MGPIQTLEDLVGLIWRRKLLIVLVTLIGTALGVWYAKSRPDTYETAAVIQVEQAAFNNRTDGPQPNPLQILQSIEQRLTTRDNMAALIERHGLFADAPGLSTVEKVVAMRNSIRFQSVSSATGSGLSAIIVVAQSGKAEDAAKIANDLAQSILDLGAEGKRAAANAAFDFFKSEEARLWQQLADLETEIAAYREENRLALPAARGARQDEIQQLSTTLRALDLELAGLQSEEASIRQNQTLRATDRRRLEEVGQRISVLLAQQAPLLERKTQLETVQANGAEVDRALTAFERQQRQLQDQYTVVSQRLAEAETARKLSDNQQTERFALLERAIIPEYPVGSGAKKLAIAAAIGSAGLAFVLAFLLDLLHPAIRSPAQLARELNLRPIVTIPDVGPQRRWRGPEKARKMISSLIENETGRLAAGQMPGNAVILVGAALVLVVLTTLV